MKVVCGDNIKIMATYTNNYFDSIVTDSPYGLSFMNKHWDYDVPAVEFWKECLRVLKPGGHLLSFGGTRTYHRMTVNIEDAGFEIRDMISWIYGSGFPKSLNISKAIDKMNGVERETIGKYKRPDGSNARQNVISKSIWGSADGNDQDITAPATPEAKQWDGWGSALKPAVEPICVARKPIDGTIAENVLKHGTGGINIDGCRIEANEDLARVNKKDNGIFKIGNGNLNNAQQRKENGLPPQGRFPANLILDEEAAKLLDEQSGELSGAGNKIGSHKKAGSHFGVAQTQINFKYDNGGGASRFFYIAKASKSERNKGLEGFGETKVNKMGSFGSQLDYQCPDGAIRKGDKGSANMQNHHPTVKPVKLMQYLVRLVTPPDGICLDPFAGSGTTGIACKLEGFDFIGIEREKEYCDIAEARIQAWEIEKPDFEQINIEFI